jgi:hypothetical protein
MRNGREVGPGRRCDRKTINFAPQRSTRGEHPALDLHEDLPRMFEKQSTGAGQPHPPSVAIEQLDLDLFLELLDLLAERRLRDVEPLCRTREIQLFSDGNEVPQVTQLHPDLPSPCQANAN